VPTPGTAGQVVAVPRSSPVNLDYLRTVVVCDDHQYLRDAITLVLSAVPRFHIVGEASDGDTCLARVRDFRPDVLILDVSMPGGGPQLAKAAKELNPGMHIVVFSGRQDDQTRNAMLAAGADQYVVKTGRLQPLVEALDRAVGIAQATQSAQA
jgi:DNA-binding NarL/FixJ family response regulator